MSDVSSSPWPEIGELVPQSPPMILLEKVLAHDADETTCRVRIAIGNAFVDVEGHVGVQVALEFMAQTAAAHSGLQRRALGAGTRIGFLLGSRRIRFHTGRFHAGQLLDVRAREVWRDESLGSFDCSVRDATSGLLLAECILNAISPEDPSALAAGDAT
jgi:predicted hotdog family 3-hydroxylacyl-ACP dehydratase